MRIPTVHINGTDGLELFDQVVYASRAVENAIDKMRDAWPNARDYYVQGDEVMSEAVREWSARTEKLNEVHMDLGVIVVAIEKQLEKRGVDPWTPR